MSFLLRRTRKSVWVGDARNREEAAQEFQRSEQDTDGLSIYEVENDEERRSVAAGVACQRGNCSRIDFIEISREVVERYGTISSTPKNGTTPVPKANAMHCSLDWDNATLRRMAEYIFDQKIELRVFAPQDVRAALGLLDATAVVGELAQAFVQAEQAKSTKKKPGI
jgi:hypothetical protein